MITTKLKLIKKESVSKENLQETDLEEFDFNKLKRGLDIAIIHFDDNKVLYISKDKINLINSHNGNIMLQTNFMPYYNRQGDVIVSYEVAGILKKLFYKKEIVNNLKNSEEYKIIKNYVNNKPQNCFLGLKYLQHKFNNIEEKTIIHIMGILDKECIIKIIFQYKCSKCNNEMLGDINLLDEYCNKCNEKILPQNVFVLFKKL